jgi:hypothetical protein
MTPFHYPSSPANRRLRNPLTRLPTLLQGRRVALLLAGLPGCLARIPLIPAQMLGRLGEDGRAPQDPRLQRRWEHRDIRGFRAADDE